MKLLEFFIDGYKLKSIGKNGDVYIICPILITDEFLVDINNTKIERFKSLPKAIQCCEEFEDNERSRRMDSKTF